MNLAVFLSALALVESGNNDNAIGRHGELGRWQITRSVWNQHVKHHFKFEDRSFDNWARNPIVARSVAVKHLRWLVKNGVPNNSFDLAYAWNSGLNRFMRQPASKASLDYARRVDATYDDLLAKSKRGSKPSKP